MKMLKEKFSLQNGKVNLTAGYLIKFRLQHLIAEYLFLLVSINWCGYCVEDKMSEKTLPKAHTNK